MWQFWSSMVSKGVTALDAHIGGYAHEAGRSVIIVVNKWDLVEKTHRITADYRDGNPREAEVSFLCADRLHLRQDRPTRPDDCIGTINEVHKARFVRVPTRELNEFLRQETLTRGGLPSDVKIRYIAQVKVESADIRDVFE